MALPVNVHELITGLTVEWERLEFKGSWNPESILHSMCAFANDINNWGGGYIIVGIEEKDGRPILPPAGLDAGQIDAYQKKLLELCHLMTPNYFPVAVPVLFQEKHILVIWCAGGDMRPYRAPKTLGKKSESVYYVRRFSSTVRASSSEDQQLFKLAAKVPFDDRINQNADLEDMNFTLIKAFLKEVGSDLYKSADSVSFKDLCLQMQIARGPPEYLKPVNAGLLFFTENPDRLFNGTRIEIVEYYDEIGDRFTEKIFTGPLHIQLKNALQYLKNLVLKEEVRKVPDRAEALRYFNYPYRALEEALANAVYHKSYEERSPIEVNVRLDRIEILSFPGPVPPVNNKQLKQARVAARNYRNRRIGDFLKELHLTEGRSTGIPKIRQAMKRNGSPPPIFETDDDLNYFLTILPVHPAFINQPRADRTAEARPAYLPDERSLDILEFCLQPRKRSEIMEHIGLTNQTKNVRTSIQPLLDQGYLAYTIPTRPKDRNQRYRTTERGAKLLGMYYEEKPEQISSR